MSDMILPQRGGDQAVKFGSGQRQYQAEGECSYCGKALTGRQRKFCSKRCSEDERLETWRFQNAKITTDGRDERIAELDQLIAAGWDDVTPEGQQILARLKRSREIQEMRERRGR